MRIEHGDQLVESPEKENYDEFYWWLAGVLDASSSIRFAHHVRASGRVRIQPIVAFSNRDEPEKLVALCTFLKEKMDFLPAVLESKDAKFRIFDANAVEFVKPIDRKAPTRRKIISLFEKWQKNEDPETRLLIYQESLKIDGRVEVHEYDDLLDNRDFVAGIVDWRATPFMSECLDRGKYRVRSGMCMNSLNESLLRALKDRFGGSMRNVNDGRSWQWRIEGKAYKALIEYVKDNCRIVNLVSTQEIAPESGRINQITENKPELLSDNMVRYCQILGIYEVNTKTEVCSLSSFKKEIVARLITKLVRYKHDNGVVLTWFAYEYARRYGTDEFSAKEFFDLLNKIGVSNQFLEIKSTEDLR